MYAHFYDLTSLAARILMGPGIIAARVVQSNPKSSTYS